MPPHVAVPSLVIACMPPPTRAQLALPRATTFVDIGANKGFWSAEVFALWRPEVRVRCYVFLRWRRSLVALLTLASRHRPLDRLNPPNTRCHATTRTRRMPSVATSRHGSNAESGS